MTTKPATKVNSKGKTLYLSASGKSYSANNSQQVKTRFTNVGGQKVTVLKGGSKTYNGSPQGQVLGASTTETSPALTKLSIDNAQPVVSANTPSKLISELSIGLSKGQNITQDQINRARTSGASLLSAPSTVPSLTSPSSAPGTPSSNQTGVGGGGGKYSRYGLGDDDEPLVETPSYEDIQKQLMRDAQKQVNSLRKYENSLLQEQSQVNQENQRQNASVNTLTGLAGSSEANVTTQRVAQEGQRANQQIQAQVQTQIQSVLANVRKDARDLYQFERSESRLDQNQADARNKEAYTRAQTNAALLAGSGATVEGYAQTDPEGYQYLAQTLGGEDVVKAMFTLNRPQEQIVDKKIEGGKYIIAYKNPLDGKMRIETVDLGLPPQYTKTIDAGDRILAIPDNWSGDPSELITVNKGLTPTQQANGGTGGGTTTQYASDLDAIIGATKATITSKFGQETFENQMKRARSEADKINLVASVVLGKADSQTKTDFANQAVGIKQIDKAIKKLDEGVQTGVLQAGAQYAYNLVGKDFDPKIAEINQLITSAIQPYRNSVTGAAWGEQEDGEYQMLFGSTRYSPIELKQRLQGVKEILASKSATALNSYVNPIGYYSNPFESGQYAPQGNSGGVLRSPDGTQEVSVSDLSPAEIQEARNAGWI
jgi:hypothetical protein